jgi:hypothetical protein
MTGIINKTQAQSTTRFTLDRDQGLRSLLNMKLVDFEISRDFRGIGNPAKVSLRSEGFPSEGRFILVGSEALGR